MKIVINTRHGGFSLTDQAIEKYKSMKNIEGKVYDFEIPREDPVLVEIVEEMGSESGGCFSDLKVVEIPDGVEWQIDEYDGLEWVAERHRTWR